MSIESPSPPTAILEGYLKAVHEIGRGKKVVRVRDIATRVKVKMPTVTNMLKKPNCRGLVRYEKYGFVELKQKGLYTAREMHRRHLLLMTFLTGTLWVSALVADKEACGMEHAPSRTTIDRLSYFIVGARPHRTNLENCLKQNHKPGAKLNESSPDMVQAHPSEEVSLFE